MWKNRKKLAEIPRKRGKGIEGELLRANEIETLKKSTGRVRNRNGQEVTDSRHPVTAGQK